MTILITGASGFVGQALVRRLPEAIAPTSSDLDLTDAVRVREAVADIRPEVVVHLAARVGGITANMTRPADFLIDNLSIDSNLLSALRATRPIHLLSMLSTCMYPDHLPEDRYPMPEEAIEDGPPPPTNAAYATAKRALWHGTKALHDQYRVGYTALVPSNLYGPGDHFGSGDSHFLAAAVHRIESAKRAGEETVRFFGSGTAMRQYLFVDDLADLVAHLACTDPLNGTVNVAPQRAYSIRELADLVADLAGYDGEVEFSATGPDGQLRKDVASERLRRCLPRWQEFETPLEQGLSRTIDWYRSCVAAG